MTIRIPAFNLALSTTSYGVIVTVPSDLPDFVAKRLASVYELLDGVGTASLDTTDGGRLIYVRRVNAFVRPEAIFRGVFKLNLAIKQAANEPGYDVEFRSDTAPTTSGNSHWREPLSYDVWVIDTIESLHCSEDATDIETAQAFSHSTGILHASIQQGGRQLIITKSSWQGTPEELASLVAMYVWSKSLETIVCDRLPVETAVTRHLVSP